MSRARVLVTGGSGMVGRALLRNAELRRHELLAPGRSELDLRDGTAVEAYVREHAPDLVVHAAGKVGGIAANLQDPVGFLVENLDIGRSVLLAARAARVPRLLNLASSCVYPRDAPNPLREDSILVGQLEPTNEGYALAKAVALRLGQYLRKADPSLDYKTLIPCNLYGPHDKFDALNAHLVPALIRRMHEAKIAGAPTVTMWGDGTARREFMFVDDLAACVARAVDRFDTLPDLMNVGLGHDHSIAEYYGAVAACVGYEGRFEKDLTKPVGMRQKVVDTTRQTAWGWKPATALADGLRATYTYFRGLPAVTA
jgi:GDP-L-fucose synthase